jgi:hypothetical protein
MISGRFVAPSFFQNLQPVANMLVGAYMGKQSDTQAQKLYEAQQERANATNQGLVEALRGTKAQAGNLPLQGTNQAIGSIEEPMGNYVAPSASTPPDQAKILALALQGKTPFSQSVATHAFQQMNKQPELINVAQGATVGERGPDGTFKKLYENPKEVKIPDILEVTAIRLGINPNPATWTPQQRDAVDRKILADKKAGAPVSTTYVTAANKFAGGFGEKASGGAYNLYEAAQNAPQQIENARRTIQLVDSGALTGPTANVGLAAAKLFNVLGSDNKDTIKQTELLFSNRGKVLLGSVKQSGLAGSQGLTEGERKFLTAAEGGSITLNAETLKAMAGLEIKTAVQNQKKWNDQAAKMDKDILKASGAGPVPVYTGIGTVDQKLVDKY